MSLTGDFSKLQKMVTELRSVRGLVGELTLVAKGRVMSLFSNQFSDQKDPWGNTWEPAADGKTPVLFETGALASAAITSTRGTVRVKPPKYWVFHQVGANGMKERAVLPFGASNWNPPIEQAIDDQVKRHFKSRED